MSRIVIAGGGWAGCAAAIAARNQGAEVLLIERTDMLLGTGLVGGIFRNNGRYTAIEEMLVMGGGKMFKIMDDNVRHKNFEFPGHRHASMYDVVTIENSVTEALLESGVQILMEHRISHVQMDGKRISALICDNDKILEGDVFIDATGTAGPQGNCTKFGNGCAMCVLRCASFGGRISIAAKAGVHELVCKKEDGTAGAMSGSCKLSKDSVDPAIVKEMEEKGVVVLPLPVEMIQRGKLSKKCCQQYALPEYENNLILLDSGHVKLMSPYMPVEQLRKIPGLKKARYVDPYSGGMGNSIRFLAMSPRNDALEVIGVESLFCAGEKAGLLVGHTEAACTGELAGYNAALKAEGLPLLVLPETTSVGDSIRHVRIQMDTAAGMSRKYTFSGSIYFERMKELGLYTTNIGQIKSRIKDAGLTGIFSTNAVNKN